MSDSAGRSPSPLPLYDRDGYLAALSAELDEERRVNADLRSQVWRLQRALGER